ncbi:zinc protease [Cricetibacter osteomyelitidis]|uniref:Zinc protease n=1 Tax=Cricetibacter osteomyelitidis TaxID=1521931 RepID=A0A4R2SUL3_9PAST|nr:M16 family metallopeptidase [Cricetibacter osteomyelitidis]TCP92014.1 zinc protease [Cricetibacter osteomyelitidis]
MRFLFSFFMLCAMSSASVLALAASSNSTQSHSNPTPVQGELENGLRYTIVPLHSQPNRVDVLMRVYAGAVDETPAQSGGAHMVEHMAFRASQAYPQGIMPYLHQQGWLRGKNYNAFTNQENTTYIYMPPQGFGLERSLEIVRQMLFKAEITQADLDDERKIVLEEWRSRDSAKRRLYEQRQSSFRAGSRYENRAVIGSQQSIQTMPATELQRYYQTWYVPNNMQLLLVGDIEVKNAEKLIRTFFADLPRKALPPRDKGYYEPALQTGIRTDRLSDPQNNNSQVAYLWRFDDQAAQAQTPQGFEQRLLDGVALNLINQRFREDKKNLPSYLTAISARKIAVGKTTSALIFSANVEKQSHHQGAQHLLNEAARLLAYPITETELQKQKAKIKAQVQNDKEMQNNFTFEDWVQHMISTLLNDKAYYTQEEIEQMTLQGLRQISLQQVNARIQSWLQADDQILQYMPPLEIAVPTISPAQVVQWRDKAQHTQFSAPPGMNNQPMQLAPLNTTGKIIKEQRFPQQHTVRWTLSNGDVVVWSKSPIAKSKTYFVAQNQAGSNAATLHDWQGKLAIQAIAANAPQDWSANQMLEWKETHSLPLVIRQSFDRLTILSTVENDKFADLLRFYYAQQRETGIKEELDKIKTERIRALELQQDSPDYRRNLAWEQFVYGRAINPQPSIDEVKNIDAATLAQQWQAMTNAPTTFFLLNNLEETQVRQVVQQNLAAIERPQPVTTAPLMVAEGSGEAHFALNNEPKDNVYISWFSPYQWQEKDALATDLLSSIASEKLSQKLRDETLGIYSKRFKTRLQPEANRVQTTLTFSADPQMTEKLIAMAQQVLTDLPQSITQEELTTAKNYFDQTLEQQKSSPDAWLERLIYSENQFHDPRYLTDLKPLADSITLADIKKMATQVYNLKNQRVFITEAKGKREGEY